jgi:predicted enzyme involved in methoxymalonyl-ACP biosynthesis
MSCRVLGRKVEEAMLREVAQEAKSRGADLLVGRYVPTAKNNMVRDHYTKLGFDLVGETGGGSLLFHLDLTTYEPPTLPLAVKRQRSGVEQQTSVLV